MVNYQNGKIYKLVNNVDDEIYVGSTCNPLYKRKGSHKSSAKIHPNIKVYNHLNEVGWENVEIVLIENFSCDLKDELHRRERYWIDTLKPSLNKVIPTRTNQEYKQIPEVKNNNRIWMNENYTHKPENKQRKKNYDAEYNKANKEVISQKKKEYRKANKELISQKKKEVITCECGSTFRKDDLSQHKKTKKHLFWEKQYNYIYS